MRLLLLIVLCLPCQLFAQNRSAGRASVTPRKEVCLNGLWDFTPNGSVKQKTQIRVPGAYTNVWDGKWGKPYWDAFGYPRQWNKGAIYEKQINVSDSLLNKHLRLRVEGCWQNYTVIWDNHIFDTIHDGYSVRYFDLGKYTTTGLHQLVIRVEDEATRLSGGESMKSRGIWDDIALEALPDAYVDKGLVIRTSVAKQSITCVAPLHNATDKDAKVLLKFLVTDAKGQVVKSFDGGWQSVSANATKTVDMEFNWEDARQWFPHDPYLYHLQTELYAEDGKTLIDRHKVRFGFREITWSGHRMYLNGRELLLRGHGEHYLGDIQASRAYFTAWFTELMKMGVNFMRLHIYPRHKILYEVADELGFLLEAEPAFHFKVPENQAFAKQHLGDMMQNLINHPSIFTWSVSNELRWQGGGEKPWLIDHARKIDPTRPAFASDFSAFSVHGDLIGHHYNTDSVFREWEQFGPNKPMVWDECGEVWQPNRPLGNGTAGYEVVAQDYATGIYRDGNNEIKAAFDLVREGKEFNGSLHRINAISPWDFGCVFFRWQPYNRFKGIKPTYNNLNTWGVKPIQILPCTTPVNIWDSTLPVYEPNPGYYLFAEDMKWVRIPYDSKNFTFFGGETTTVKTPLLQYDDLRWTDEVHCKVESIDGKLLTEKIQPLVLKPGDMLRNINWSFTLPTVSAAMPVRLVREFWYQGKSGYRDEREGNIFPRLTASSLRLKQNKIGVLASDTAVVNMLKWLQLPYWAVAKADTAALHDIADKCAVLLVQDGIQGKESWLQKVLKKDISVVQFITQPTKAASSARLLANGAPYQLLKGIDQASLSYWRGGNAYGGMQWPKGASRVLLAGDKDGKTSALHEMYVGKACHWVTSLRLVAAVREEPTAQLLLQRLIQSAIDYQPTLVTKKTAVFGSTDFIQWVQKANANIKPITSLTDPVLQQVQVLLLDARTSLPNNQAAIKPLQSFVSNGGKLVVYQMNDQTIPFYQQLISDSLTLSNPFIGEKTGCVKAATSWTLRNSPKTGIEYYDSVVIPQPFEPNFHPFLSGLSNITLNWNGVPMFEKGIKMKGISPVGVSNRFQMLVSNWRNDWSVPPFGAEYINEGKDMRQALWYLNRDPVLATMQQGKGEIILCQLDLLRGGEKGQTIFQHLLNYYEAGQNTFYPTRGKIFSIAEAIDQHKRLAVVVKQLAALTPLDSVPSVIYNMGGNSDGKQRRILLLPDSRFLQIAPDIIKKMSGFGQVAYSGVTVNAPKDFLQNTESALGGAKWDVVYMSIGYEGITVFSEAGLQQLDADILKIITTLKNTGAKLMWGSQPPLPTAWFGVLDNEKINLLNQRVKKIMEANSVLVNDTYSFMMEKTPEYIAQDKKELTLINSDFFKAFSPKLVKTIVEALQFFGN